MRLSRATAATVGAFLAELPDMPAIIRQMSDEEAVVELVDSSSEGRYSSL